MQLPANDPRDPLNTIIRPGTPVSCRPWAGRPRRCRPWRCLTWRLRMTGATSRPTCGRGWSWMVARRWALGQVEWMALVGTAASNSTRIYLGSILQYGSMMLHVFWFQAFRDDVVLSQAATVVNFPEPANWPASCSGICRYANFKP